MVQYVLFAGAASFTKGVIYPMLPRLVVGRAQDRVALFLSICLSSTALSCCGTWIEFMLRPLFFGFYQGMYLRQKLVVRT